MIRPLLLLPVYTAVLCLAFTPPNFSGEWKADIAKSDFGDIPAPDSIVMQIDHADPKLSVKQHQTGGPLGELHAELNYTTDGTESRSTVRGSELVSNGKWSGDTLKINTKLTWEDNALTIIETWKLASDGQSLELSREIINPDGTSTMKLLFTKTDKK